MPYVSGCFYTLFVIWPVLCFSQFYVAWRCLFGLKLEKKGFLLIFRSHRFRFYLIGNLIPGQACFNIHWFCGGSRTNR
ncbi:hypothetical protein BKA69DRAFT_1096668 [Paraphysoderma sedebokerense]|nr:hypothetical protein BKA69DRAFT_1096668 [Paraphysoderma sedebokerense]